VAQCLGVMRTAIPERRVQPHAVGKHCDVLDHVCSCFLPRRLLPLGDACALETPEEAFGHCVVSALPLPTPAAADPMGLEPLLGGLTGLWTPTIRVLEHPGGRVPPCESHPQRLLDHSGIAATTQSPPHDFTRGQGEQDGERSPALGRPEIGEISHPHLLWLLHITRPRQEMRGDAIAMATGRGVGRRYVGRRTTTPASRIHRRAWHRPTA
jgi:hypothetical protein